MHLPLQHPYRTRRQDLTIQVSPLSLIPRTLLLPPLVPPFPPLVQPAMPCIHTYVLVDS